MSEQDLKARFIVVAMLMLSVPAWAQRAPPVEPAPGLVLPLQITLTQKGTLPIAFQAPDILWIAQRDGIYRWSESEGTLRHVARIEGISEITFASDRLWLYRVTLTPEPSAQPGFRAHADIEVSTLNPLDNNITQLGTLENASDVFHGGPFFSEDEHHLLFTTDRQTLIWQKSDRQLISQEGSVIAVAGAGLRRTLVLGGTLQRGVERLSEARPTRLCRMHGKSHQEKQRACREFAGYDLVHSDGENLWLIRLQVDQHFEVHQVDLATWETSLVAKVPLPTPTREKPGEEQVGPYVGTLLSKPYLFIQVGQELHRINLVTNEVSTRKRLLANSTFTKMYPGPTPGTLFIYVDTARALGTRRQSYLYEWAGAVPEPILELDGRVDSVETHPEGSTWVFGSNQTFTRKRVGAPFRRLSWAVPAEFGSRQRGLPLEDSLVMVLKKGTVSTFFRWSPDPRIEARLISDRADLEASFDPVITALSSLFTGHRTPVVSGYHRLSLEYASPAEGTAPVPPRPEEALFKVALAEDLPGPRQQLSPLEDFRFRIGLQQYLPARNADLHLRATDRFGNLFEHRFETTVVAGPIGAMVLCYACLLLLFLGVVLIAPWNRFANTVVMNPSLRKWGSLMAMSIILTVVPILRRHLLRRYRRNLRQTLKGTIAGYLPPEPSWTAEAFAKQLEERRCILITGSSGLGKSAFLAHFADHAAQHPRTTGRIDLPVLIRLREYAADTPEAVLASQLKALGQFNDDDLQAELSRHGRILFLVDGLNEVPEATRQRWSAFRRDHAFNHLFVFTSQAHEYEFQDLPQTLLAQLSAPQARALLIRDFGVPEDAVEALPPQVLEFARNPQNLKTLGTLLAAKKPVPRDQFGLYFAILNPIDETWARNGQAHYGEQLAQAALKHLQEAQVDLTTALAPGALNTLREERLVVLRSGKLEFAHDRLAAFLAASHLDRNPETAARLNIAKATNWQFVIDLLVEHTSMEAAETLALGLLENPSPGALKLAEQFVFDLHASRGPHLGHWVDDFDRLLTVKRRGRRHARAA